jgi:hypothetical protein
MYFSYVDWGVWLMAQTGFSAKTLAQEVHLIAEDPATVDQCQIF